MKYTVYARTKYGQSYKESYENLDEAIQYCKAHKCKYGHTVESFGVCGKTESGKDIWGTITHYED